MSAVVLYIALRCCVQRCGAVACFGVAWGRFGRPKGLTACAKYRIDLKRTWKALKSAVFRVGRTCAEAALGLLVCYITLASARGKHNKFANDRLHTTHASRDD